jgi:hypothetical protein
VYTCRIHGCGFIFLVRAVESTIPSSLKKIRPAVWYYQTDGPSRSEAFRNNKNGAENGGFVATAVPINTSPKIEQYQRNNQPPPELSTTCLDEIRRIDLIISVLRFGPFGFVATIASTNPISPIDVTHRLILDYRRTICMKLDEVESSKHLPSRNCLFLSALPLQR